MDEYHVYQVKFCHSGVDIAQGEIKLCSSQAEAEDHIKNYNGPKLILDNY